MNNNDLDVITKQGYYVVKGNELIQKNRYKLSLAAQKTIAYICSMIKPLSSSRDSQNLFQLTYKFNIREYCEICGADYDNGKNYANAKKILKGLRDKSMWLTMEDGSETLVGWLSKVTLCKGSGIATVTLDDDLVPYLFALGGQFTQYQLCNILSMKSAFSIRMYELLKSYGFQKSKIFAIEELKHLLMVDDIKSYERFPDFRRRVLDIACDEINALTDIVVKYELIKNGRKFEKIKFFIREKSSQELLLVEKSEKNFAASM